MNVPPATTYERQLAERVAELLPGLATDARLELLGAMDPDDMRTSMAWLVSFAPQTFDFALVRDRKLVERLQDRLDHQHNDDPEPYCTTCGAKAGIFIAHGDAWLHYTGEGTVASPVELYDAGHEPVIAWRPVGAGNLPRYEADERDQCGALDRDSGYICTAQAGHDGPDHVNHRALAGKGHRWPMAEPKAATVLLAELRDRMGVGEPLDRPGDEFAKDGA